uniref:PhoD-like phosphatase metallophosphatase domain-containing protein n=1 Tax=Hyaloperonospora arabidopsidis (strain Emoy2) TaxID=559515 RepID=M4C1D9_HYAAE
MLRKTSGSALAAAVAVFVRCSASSTGTELTVLASPRVQDLEKPLQRVAFGSCNDQSFPQPLWPKIAAHEPELWIWMGDNIYADMKELGEPRRSVSARPRDMFVEASPEVLVQRYNKLMANTGYAAFVKRTPVIGIWDDHDYGINDGGKMFSYREESQEGIYTSYTIGSGEQTVKFILVDNRYHRDAYGMKNGTLLGETQWEWLGNELLTSTAAFNVIVSGVQILPGDRYPIAECWGRFPSERERMLKLLLASNAKGVILLSGDVHFSEINQVVCSKGANKITEITSSGMTHSWMEFHVPSVKHVMALLFTYANFMLPWEFRLTQKSFYGHLNWGSIEIDWDHKPHPVATVQVHGADDQVKLQYSFQSTILGSTSSEQDAVDCQAPRPVSGWQRFMWLGLFVVVVGASLLSIPFVLFWLLRLFVRKFKTMICAGATEKQDDSKKTV